MFEKETDDGMERELLERLRDPLVWEALESWTASPVPAFGARLESEDETAAVLCEEIFTGPPAWWPQRLRRTDGAQTAGMVRAILQRARLLSESRPPDALQATLMAEVVAEALEPEAYPRTVVVRLRSLALREQAAVLWFMGRYGECLEVAERSKRLIEWLPCAEWDLARLAQVKASALQNLNRTEEAAELAREAGETFLRFGDRPRYVGARMIEAAALYEGGQVERALEIWRSLEGDRGVDAVGAVRLAHNVAMCVVDLGREVETVVEPLRRCAAEFERHGMLAERTRSRWTLGTALMVSGRIPEAIGVLRTAWREFAEMKLMVDAALAALDLAEALLANEEPNSVPAICREVIAQLTTAGMAPRAIPALSLLREAAAMGRASRTLVQETRAVVGRAGR